MVPIQARCRNRKTVVVRLRNDEHNTTDSTVQYDALRRNRAYLIGVDDLHDLVLEVLSEHVDGDVARTLDDLQLRLLLHRHDERHRGADVNLPTQTR